MKEKDKGEWNIFGDYAFFVQRGDWVDKDYAQILIEQLKKLQTDMIICGVIHVQKNRFKRADFYEYEKVLSGKEGRIELFEKGYLENGFCGCLIKKNLLEDKKDLYGIMVKSDRIGILNDYKYYHQYQERTTETYKGLQERWRTCKDMLADWSEEEIWRLFTRKEKLFLQYPMFGSIVCSGSGWLQRNHKNIYNFIQKTVDSQLEKRIRLESVFVNKMKETKQYPRILIMGTPEYHNLGDHAIAFSQEKFCQSYFPDHKMVNVTEKTIFSHFRFLQQQIKESDILLLQGGGNIGDEYQTIEELRIKIIQGFPQNKIVIMPQTIYFTNCKAGRILLSKMKKIYSLHSRLMIVGREKTSYERMKSYFPQNKIIQCPDMVLSLDIQKKLPATTRKGILLLLRTDAEGTLRIDHLMKVKELCSKRADDAKMTETSVSYSISQSHRTEELLKKWKQISSAKLIITDRLHGMIFAAITGTPCFVLSNYNHKIKESYEWIKELEYIKFCNNIGELERELEHIDQLCGKQYVYQKEVLQFHYDRLAMAMKE